MHIICHRRKVKLNEFNVITKDGKKYNYLDESMLIGKCTHCNNLHVIHAYISSQGKKIELNYEGKKAQKQLRKIIQKQPLYDDKQVDYRPFLNYNEYGLTKKCYSNLSNIKLGKEDTYQGLSKDYNAA